MIRKWRNQNDIPTLKAGVIKIKIENQALIQREHINQGPVVQTFVSLTLSLSPQFANYISTSKANTLSLLLKKCENPALQRVLTFKKKITVYL